MPFNLKHTLISQYSKFIPQQKIIGVCGSLDKSSTILASQMVLSQLGNLAVITDSIPSNPGALFQITPNTKKALVEISLNHPSDAQKVLKLINPEVLIVTSIIEGQDGLSADQQIEEYSHLAVALPKNGALILNWDNIACRKLAEKTEAEVIFYGSDQKNCHIWVGNVQISKFRVIFELNYGVERVEIATNFINKQQIYSLLAATALGLREGLRLTQIKAKLEKVQPLEHRMEVISGFNGSTVIDASVDGAIASTTQSVDGLNFIPARRRIVVLGPMVGGNLDKNYRQIAQKIYQDKVDLVLLSKGEIGIVADELLKLGFIASRLEQDLTNPQIVSQLLKVLGKGDVVLIKGVKDVRLDEVVLKISKKS